MNDTSTITNVQVSSDVVPTAGAVSATVVGRLVGTTNYSARLRFEPGGVLRMYLLRGETSLNGGGYIVPGSYAAGQVVNVSLSVRGTAPTGGFGRVLGLVLALAILQILSSGLNLLGVSPFLTMVVWGAIILLVMAIGRAISFFAKGPAR